MSRYETLLQIEGKRRYEAKYGKLSSGHYLSIWLSKSSNLMVRHLVEEHEWTKDTCIREVNLGQYWSPSVQADTLNNKELKTESK